MTNLNKFLLSIIKEQSTEYPITHECAIRRKVSKAKLKRLTSVLHSFGMPKEMYLRIKKCDTCKAETKWKIAYHLETAYRCKLSDLLDSDWVSYTITKINRLTNEKVEYNLGLAKFKKIVQDYDVLDANTTSEQDRYCIVFANDNYKYIIDGKVKKPLTNN